MFDSVKDINVEYVDFRTKARYEEYLAAGMNVLVLQAHDEFGNSGETFEGSNLENIMNTAYSSGIGRVVVFDKRLENLTRKEEPIVGSGCQFATQAELVYYVKNCLSDYSDHPAFYGVRLVDEPTWKQLPQMGAVYQALKTVMPEIYVDINLLPNYANISAYVDISAAGNENLTRAEAFEQYLELYVSSTNYMADRICFDSYPIRADANGNHYTLTSHIACVQAVAKIAEKYGLRMVGVVQSSAWYDGEMNLTHGAPTKEEMWWQLNALIAFGCDEFAYFTYQTKQMSNAQDDSSFIDRNGDVNQLYYDMQDIHGKVQELAPVILNYGYVASKYFCNGTAPSYISGMESAESLSSIKGVQIDGNAVALISELENAANEKMYAVMNTDQPELTEESLSISITFEGATQAEIFVDGVWQTVALEGGVLELTVAAGHAVYVIVK